MFSHADVRMTPKRWRLKGHRDRGLWGLISKRAMTMLHHRITVRGKAADGRRLPRLKSRKGWFFESADNPRAESQPGAKLRRAKGERGGRRSLSVVSGGYGKAKLARGKRDRRDGNFTGTMWDSLTPKIKISRRGASLLLRFARNDKGIAKVGTGIYSVKTRREGKRGVRNRDKAAWLQTSGQGLKGRVLFSLMEYSQAELESIRAIILRRIRLG